MMSHYIITAQVQRHAFKITVSVKFEYICANSINCVITFYILGFLLLLFIVEYIIFIDQLLVLLQCRLQLNLRIKFLRQKRQYPNYPLGGCLACCFAYVGSLCVTQRRMEYLL